MKVPLNWLWSTGMYWKTLFAHADGDLLLDSAFLFFELGLGVLGVGVVLTPTKEVPER